MNDEMVKAGTTTNWSNTEGLDLRNRAAHGDYGADGKTQVAGYLQAIREFLVRHPA